MSDNTIDTSTKRFLITPKSPMTVGKIMNSKQRKAIFAAKKGKGLSVKTPKIVR